MSALYYLDMEGNYFYSACSVLSVILSLAHDTQIPHPCLGVKQYTLWGDNISIVNWSGLEKARLTLTLDKIYKSALALLFTGHWQKYFPWKEDGRRSVVWQNCISQLFQLNWSTECLGAYQIMHGPLFAHIRLATNFDPALFILWPNDCG